MRTASCEYTKALIFAAKAHEGQYRKYTGEPYITHPIAVSEIVRSVTHDESLHIAALLHDVVEDTPFTLRHIEDEFGTRVSRIVEMVTDISKPEDGNRATRKQIDIEHLAKASTDGCTIKIADLIHNTESIVDHDPRFARVYLEEKDNTLKVLFRGNSTLLDRAFSQLTSHRYSEV
jgi:(p)ppGpp synthase/HD superfamily hydrolase